MLDEHLKFMQEALHEANKAGQRDEVPIGAVVVNLDGQIIGRGHNLKESNHDPLGHAELLAIRQATGQIENWRLEECTLYVTLEPCPMCLAAMVQSRIKRVIFGAYDPKGGALSLGYNLHNDPRFNHRFAVVGGLDPKGACSQILSDFFRQKRVK